MWPNSSRGPRNQPSGASGNPDQLQASLCFLGLAPPDVWIASRHNALVLPLAKEFRVKIVAALVADLRFFNDNRMSPSPRIFADPCHLPAHTPRHATSNPELSMCNFIGDVKLRCRGSDWRQLVTESLIERLKSAGSITAASPLASKALTYPNTKCGDEI